MKIIRKISNINLCFEIENNHKQILKVINTIGENTGSETYSGIIRLQTGQKNTINLASDFSKITIGGPNINNMTDPFIYIGFLQAFSRFAALHLCKTGVFLLHGSAAILKDHAIIFGDDGTSTAKTLSSIELALKSKYYVVDEFCFYDLNKNEVFNIGGIPIHLRDIVHKSLISRGFFKNFENKYFSNSEAGIFFFENNYFETITKASAKCICFTYFNNKEPRKVKLNGDEKIRALSFCVTAHIAKLFYPNLDRMSFIDNKDDIGHIEYSQELMEEILDKLDLRKDIKRISRKINCYRLNIKYPHQIPSLFKD